VRIRAIRVILLRLVLQLIFAECRVLCFQFIEQAPGSPKAPSASFVQQAICDIAKPENSVIWLNLIWFKLVVFTTVEYKRPAPTRLGHLPVYL